MNHDALLILLSVPLREAFIYCKALVQQINAHVGFSEVFVEEGQVAIGEEVVESGVVADADDVTEGVGVVSNHSRQTNLSIFVSHLACVAREGFIECRRVFNIIVAAVFRAVVHAMTCLPACHILHRGTREVTILDFVFACIVRGASCQLPGSVVVGKFDCWIG